MKMSESLQKNVLEVSIGRIINTLRIKKRRDVLFFEDILANYIEVCERAGYDKEMQNIAQKWMYCVISQTIPSVFLKTHSQVFVINDLLRMIWINLGLVDDVRATKKGDIIEISTINESTTRVIGKNMFAVGSYMGILNALFESNVDCIDAIKKEKSCVYRFKLTSGSYRCLFKERSRYDNLNDFQKKEGFTLKSAMDRGVLQLKENNRVYYRGKSVTLGEQTLFHIIGNQGLLLDKIPEISYDFFEEVILKDSSAEDKLINIKTVLQVMGWGEILFEYEPDNICMKIKNPPYGFQIERDNWDFLINVILGYVWLINRKFRIKSIEAAQKYVYVVYSKA